MDLFILIMIGFAVGMWAINAIFYPVPKTKRQPSKWQLEEEEIAKKQRNPFQNDSDNNIW